MFNTIKLWGAMVLAGMGVLLTIKFNSMSNKLKRRKVEVDALKENLETQEIVHKQDIENERFMSKVEKDNANVEAEVNIEIKYNKDGGEITI